MVLRTEDLVKKYGKRTVVSHVSIDVKQGEIVGLLGPNGAGKTTSFYMTVGLITPNEGRVRMGLVKSDNPDLDRFQSTLNTVFLDKKEEYQKQSTAKGGAIDDKRLGNSTIDDANSDESGN